LPVSASATHPTLQDGALCCYSPHLTSQAPALLLQALNLLDVLFVSQTHTLADSVVLMLGLLQLRAQ
jgi:hypothetical protein